ncbi:hypothetical protein PPYR_08047 [Photinus pyralis]|uniref:MH2 domain-containing protein n=1 Tax=Photinus pyralis TaxID=7054 RepID=A0A5N4AS54_PHOPY|nr:hypothetical protein PPYR_08047 [Photinus pyralis]
MNRYSFHTPERFKEDFSSCSRSNDSVILLYSRISKKNKSNACGGISCIAIVFALKLLQNIHIPTYTNILADYRSKLRITYILSSRIGLCGFENPMRDPKTEDLKRHIGHGVKIKMDDSGNILIKRLSKCNVYIKNGGQDEENAIGNEILRMPGCAIEPEKPFKLFDMKKFQSNVNRELRRAYPDRRRLEYQCISAIAFVKSELQLLECPIWVLIINIVAIDMLKSKLPPVQRAVDIKNRPRIPIPDEDPYSIAGNGDGSSRNLGLTDTIGMAPSREALLLQGQHFPRRSEKPPKLPPRENWYSHNIPKPDYDDTENNRSVKPFTRGKGKAKNKDKKYDDPYYCGLRARVPNFVSKSKGKESNTSKRFSVIHHQIPPPLQARHSLYTHQHHLQHQPMWHTRSFESGIDVEPTESPYQIYGFLRPPSRVYSTSTINQPRAMYIGQWN